MPFTFSHPAAILPFRRCPRLPLLALIAGSIAPDLQHFLPAALAGYFPRTHSLSGALVSGPVAALVWLALVRALRRPLASPLPGRHRRLVAEALDRFGVSLSDWLWAVPAVYIGVALHLFWDSFTHAYGWPVREWAVLRTEVSVIGVRTEVFHALQWLSSVIGLALLAAYYGKAIQRVPVESIPDPLARTRAIALGVSCLAAVAAVALRIHEIPVSHRSIYGMGFVASTTAVSTFAIVYIALGVCVERLADRVA